MVKILCSAIIIEDNIMLCGLRHFNCINKIKQIYEVPKKIIEQGFLTSEGSFVNREKALAIAQNANQIIYPRIVNSDTLYSEDLY